MCDIGFIYSNNCQVCNACFNNCSCCPAGKCQERTMYFDNLNRINKQVRMASSLGMLQRKSLVVSRQVGQSAAPSRLTQAGGPGDLISAVQKTNRCKSLYPPPADCKSTTYRLPIVQRRTANKGASGVDRKHGSYARYLARRTGGVLRKEQMPVVRNRTAYIHQPRNRTGTAAGCTNYTGCNSNATFKPPTKFLGRSRTAFKCNDSVSQAANYGKKNNAVYPYWALSKKDVSPSVWEGTGFGIKPLFGPTDVVGEEDGTCCSTKCCENRIPGGSNMGKYVYKCGEIDGTTYNCPRDIKSQNLGGLLGNNTQCVPSGSCSCCPKVIQSQ